MSAFLGAALQPALAELAIALSVFSLITYVVVELPVLSYAIWPGATAARVAAFSAWLDANKIQVVAAIGAVVGLALIVKGVTSL